MDNKKEIKINTEYIKLGQLLKLSNIVSQGSDAKLYISQGYVSLNNVVVYERGKKVYPNDIICVKLDNKVIDIRVI